MKFAKPGETETETAEPADSDPSSPVEMPVVETGLSERLALGEMPLDDVVEAHGSMIDGEMDRMAELEERVDQLEEENEELRQSLESVENALSEWAGALVQAESLSEISGARGSE